jgi:cytochrome c peroxidase
MSRALLCFLAIAWMGASLASPPTLVKDQLPERLPIEAVPAGLLRDRPVPKENPLSDSKVALGRKLFFDPVLSTDRTVACASCHDPAHGFAGKEPRAVGVGGKRGLRNAPSLLNRAYGRSLFWDGRETSLEVQALKPIVDPLEMNADLAEVIKRLAGDREYVTMFRNAFGGEPTEERLAQALASFQRTLLLGGSRVDRFRAGEIAALDDREKHGLWLWESKGKCWKCHSGPNFTDEEFHNTGVGWGREPLDLGRFQVTGKDEDRGKFKTPTLRGIALTPPYMHDGSIASLEEVIEFYDRGGVKNPHLDPAMQPLNLTDEDKKSLIAFLKALSEPTGILAPYARPGR